MKSYVYHLPIEDCRLHDVIWQKKSQILFLNIYLSWNIIWYFSLQSDGTQPGTEGGHKNTKMIESKNRKKEENYVVESRVQLNDQGSHKGQPVFQLLTFEGLHFCNS